MGNRRYLATLLTLAALLTGLFFLHLATGFHYFTKAHLIGVLLGGGTPEEVLTVFDFRMVRSILAVLIGMGLAVSGAVFQTISKNELASPSLLGVNAVRLTADVLKRIDGNLGRASAFLDSQKSNHVVRVAFPIPACPALSDPVRVAEREKCIAYARENAADWKAHLICAYRLLWADCAEDSIRAALDAFALAPFSERNLQVCADAVMHPFSVMTRDPAKVAVVRDYLLYGKLGRDGVADTADDLLDPAEFYRSCTTPEPDGSK